MNVKEIDSYIVTSEFIQIRVKSETSKGNLRGSKFKWLCEDYDNQDIKHFKNSIELLKKLLSFGEAIPYMFSTNLEDCGLDLHLMPHESLATLYYNELLLDFKELAYHPFNRFELGGLTHDPFKPELVFTQ